MDSFQEKEVGKGCERVIIRIIFPFRSYPTRNSKFQKNSKKNTLINSFRTKISWKRMRQRENKNYCSVPFLPDA